MGCVENEEVRMGQIFLSFVGHVQKLSLSLEQWEAIEGDLVIFSFVKITQPVLIGAMCMLRRLILGLLQR